MNEVFIPNARRVTGVGAEIHVLEEFLTREECEHLVDLIKRFRRPSELTNKDEPDKEFRTNWSADLEDVNDQIANDIDMRMSRLLGFERSHSEFMQGQHYLPGQRFKPHTDYFEGAEIPKYTEDLGQRTYTFLVYLNGGVLGGETSFPLLGLSFPPLAGCALIWNNLDAHGNPNPSTLHGGLQVLSGEKFVITKWFRSHHLPPVQTKEAAEYIPPYTRLGLKKTSIPRNLFHELCAFYHANAGSYQTEVGSEHLIQTRTQSGGSVVIELPEFLRRRVHEVLLPIAEDWAGVPLKPTFVYGVRVYYESAVLVPHRDRPNTHVIGALLNIDQDVREDWPLVIEDHTYREYHVGLRTGDMLLYEGARLRHSRPFPLSGNRYANVFCHFVPLDWTPIGSDA